eukprot:7899636-Heterocapsa_arctica.AAC.1
MNTSRSPYSATYPDPLLFEWQSQLGRTPRRRVAGRRRGLTHVAVVLALALDHALVAAVIALALDHAL